MGWHLEAATEAPPAGIGPLHGAHWSGPKAASSLKQPGPRWQFLHLLRQTLQILQSSQTSINFDSPAPLPSARNKPFGCTSVASISATRPATALSVL